MGRRGPAPTPTVILRTRGTFRPDRRRSDEVQYPPGKPPCPSWLSPEAKREWRRVIGHLHDAGVMTLVDRAMLAVYCEAWGEFVEAARKAAEVGFLFRAEGGVKLNPLLKVRDRAAARAVQLAGHFGFSPSTRTRIGAPAGRTEGEGPLSLKAFVASRDRQDEQDDDQGEGDAGSHQDRSGSRE
jgi:P27 family predicted phage terminase small subunit